MRENLREMFSAYLDDQVSDQERQKVETLLKTDPEAKLVLEEMRTFHKQISDSKPLHMEVPADFRKSIMKRLTADQTASDESEKNPPGGRGLGGFMKSKMMPYMLSGTVLLGLIGTFAYLDHKKAQQLSQVEDRTHEIVEMHKEKTIDMPDYKGVYHTNSQESGVQADDIQSVSSEEDGFGQIVRKGNLRGSVYVKGKGHQSKDASGTVSLLQSSDLQESMDSADTNQDESGVLLESRNKWSVATIERYYKANKTEALYTAKSMLEVADKNNLNPALLIALAETEPTINLEEAASKIRSVLNNHQGATDSKKLKAIIDAVGGKETWLEKWQAVLNY